MCAQQVLHYLHALKLSQSPTPAQSVPSFWHMGVGENKTNYFLFARTQAFFAVVATFRLALAVSFAPLSVFCTVAFVLLNVARAASSFVDCLYVASAERFAVF